MKDKNATVIINLEPSEEDILAGLHKDARWGINKAKKEGLNVRETREEKDWEEFYKIYTETMEAGGTIAMPLEELKEKATTLFVCENNNKIIAGAAIWFSELFDSEIPRLFLNASLRDYQKMQPNNLLYWACILWSKNKGYKKFDFGGYQLNAQGHLEGINKFKEKWGEIVEYEKDYSLTKAIGRKMIRKSNLLWKINQKIKAKKQP